MLEDGNAEIVFKALKQMKKNYRNKHLLSAAKEAPYCMACGTNDETIVSAHSNQIADGKGTGIKAHDFRIAFLCSKCHFFVDQGNATKEEKKEVWEAAHRATIGWLFLNNRLMYKEAPKYIF